MGETSYVIGIEILHNRSQGLLGQSQKTYIDEILKRFRMKKYLVGVVLVQKGDKFSELQCPKNNLEQKNICSGESIICLDMQQVRHKMSLGCKVDNNATLDQNIKKLQKNALWYLQGTKDYMFTYRRFKHLEVVGYSDSDFAKCVDSKKYTLHYLVLVGWRCNFMEEKTGVYIHYGG